MSLLSQVLERQVDSGGVRLTAQSIGDSRCADIFYPPYSLFLLNLLTSLTSQLLERQTDFSRDRVTQVERGQQRNGSDGVSPRTFSILPIPVLAKFAQVFRKPIFWRDGLTRITSGCRPDSNRSEGANKLTCSTLPNCHSIKSLANCLP